jgi:RHS repeat-associated protein
MKTLLARIALLVGLALAATAQAQLTLTTSPPFSCPGCGNIFATWSGLTSPSTSDILKITPPTNTNAVRWINMNGASSGTLPLDVHSGVPFGTYVVRIERAFTTLATSAPFQVVPVVNGFVTSGGSGLAGFSVSGTNGAHQCLAATDGSGFWVCYVPVGWSGTVTVSKPGNLFTPVSRSYTNVTNHIFSQNFATVPAHAITGTITKDGVGLSGAAIAGTNGALCTSTNASGQYTCTVAPGWSGTVTPSFANTVFTPASRSYTSVSAAQSAQDYTAFHTSYQVSGTVTFNGLPLPNVALAASGGPSCSSTNNAGQYSCTVPLNWSGSITPSATGYSFGPASRSYTSVSSTQTAQTFTATLATATAPLYFVHTDHLNTPRLVANDAQQAVWRWDQQEPFGVNVPDENPSSLGAFEFPLRFPGQYADKETTLFFNYFRDYDPALGRFVESDPLGLDAGINTYAYVDADPLGDFDVQGLRSNKSSGTKGGGGRGYQKQPCWLYAIYDCKGRVVYYGVTNNLDRRTREHEYAGIKKKYECPTCKFTVRDMMLFEDRFKCEATEATLIYTFAPVFNVKGNPNPPAVQLQKQQDWRKECCGA